MLVLALPGVATGYSLRVSPVSEPAPEESPSLPASPDLAEIEREVARRRTFAIISHPDAGKTTLTEKLLLYAGAIELAGAVRGRQARRHATSDWMDMEQKRGISITSAALEFELKGRRISLIDTPGHNDFSEDTLSGAYRRRRRRDGHRRRQWRRRSDAKTVRRLSAAPAADSHLRQQVRPTHERPAGVAR